MNILLAHDLKVEACVSEKGQLLVLLPPTVFGKVGMNENVTQRLSKCTFRMFTGRNLMFFGLQGFQVECWCVPHANQFQSVS